MRKLLFIALFMLVCAPFSFAQTTTDTTGPEFFVGYSNLQDEGIVGQEQNQQNNFDDELFGDRIGLNGFNVSATGFISPRFGITGDFSFNQSTEEFDQTPQTGQTNQTRQESEQRRRVLSFLAGPTIKFRNESVVTPFVRAMGGVANTRFEFEQAQISPTGTVRNEFETSSTDFALAVGGGLDVRLSDRIDLRAFQFDYSPVFLRDRTIQRLNRAGVIAPQTIEDQRADNFRISIGVVFR